MDPVVLALLGWAGMAVGMLVAWSIARRIHDAGVVDVTWSAGVGVLAIAFATAAHGDIGRRMLVAALVSVQGRSALPDSLAHLRPILSYVLGIVTHTLSSALGTCNLTAPSSKGQRIDAYRETLGQNRCRGPCIVSSAPVSPS
jgi:hypothetical protein